jgi:diacylglycerol kinase (ATP)
MVVVGNVERTAGGSMCLSPGARDDDGEIHVSIIPCKSKLAMASKIFPKVASGEHVNVPGVLHFTTRRIEVEGKSQALMDIDGDLFGTTPAAFTICPKAVKVLSHGAIVRSR